MLYRLRRCRGLLLLPLLLLALLLAGCSQQDRQLDAEDWKSWNIGTPLAWSADYYLTSQGDVPNLYRYDYMTDCLLALEFQYIDAIAVDKLYAQYVEVVMPELVIADDIEVGPDQLVVFTAVSRPDLRDELNEFIAGFIESEQHADMLYRANNFVDNEFVIDNDIPLHEQGEKLIVAVDAASGYYPYSFFDFVTQEPQGIDVEFIKRFAWEYGYVIEWFDADWDACTMALYNQRVDLMVSGCSIYFSEDMDLSGYGLYTDPYFDLELCMLVKKPSQSPNNSIGAPTQEGNRL